MWISKQRVNYWSYILHSLNNLEKRAYNWEARQLSIDLNMIQLEESSAIIFYGVWYPHERSKANKNVSEWNP